MSKYYDVALAIDARDYDILIRDIRKITPTPMELFTSTPDNDYIIFFWEYVLWEGADVNSLLHKIETLRHALYSISEDHEVWKDVEVSDSWGTDEQFYELLDVSAKLKLWDDRCNLASLRNVDAIEWAGDSEGEDLSFLPESVLIPENIPDDGIADYLSDRYGFLVASYSITSDCGKWFYAEIESLDEDFQKISLPVVVCDQCNTFFPVAYAGAGHHYCPNCGRRMAPADDAPATVGQESQDVDVTIAVDCRFTTTIYGECVDTSSREVVLAAAEAMFSDADIGDLEVIGFRPVSIQTPDGEFVWER